MMWVNIPHGIIELRTSLRPVTHLLDGGTVRATRDSLENCKIKWESGHLWFFDEDAPHMGWRLLQQDATPAHVREFFRIRPDYGWIPVE